MGNKCLHLVVSNISLLLHQEHTSYGFWLSPPGQICYRSSRHEMRWSTILNKSKLNSNRYLKIIITKKPTKPYKIPLFRIPREEKKPKLAVCHSYLVENRGGGGKWGGLEANLCTLIWQIKNRHKVKVGWENQNYLDNNSLYLLP